MRISVPAMRPILMDQRIPSEKSSPVLIAFDHDVMASAPAPYAQQHVVAMQLLAHFDCIVGVGHRLPIDFEYDVAGLQTGCRGGGCGIDGNNERPSANTAR